MENKNNWSRKRRFNEGILPGWFATLTFIAIFYWYDGRVSSEVKSIFRKVQIILLDGFLPLVAIFFTFQLNRGIMFVLVLIKVSRWDWAGPKSEPGVAHWVMQPNFFSLDWRHNFFRQTGNRGTPGRFASYYNIFLYYISAFVYFYAFI